MIRHWLKQLKIGIASLSTPKGLTGPHMSGNEWDEQFSGDKWNYLGDANQREHYDCIIDLYNKHTNKGSILDLGCGAGLLYDYFKGSNNLPHNQYLGVDISKVAIAEAAAKYPGGSFMVVNYENEDIPQKFDTVIFNETLYYFNHPGKTIEKCIAENIKPGGKLIISMCDHERHDMIWEYLEKLYKVEDVRKSANEENISWTIKILNPQR